MTKTSLFLLLSLLAFQPLYSRPDSLVDVFPLAVGNQWTYQYTKIIDDAGIECRSTDSGIAFFEVRDRMVTSDSTRWVIYQRRDVLHSWRCISGPDSIHIVDSAMFELIERHEGQHQLYLPGSAFANSGNVFPFTKRYTDTTMIYRFRTVDSTGEAKFLSSVPDPIPPPSFWGLFTFERGRGLVSVQCAGVLTPVQVSGNHTLVNSLILDVGREGAPGFEPTALRLSQNYPNPFNPTTTIEYALPEQTNVSLRLFDVLGSEVKTLVDAKQARGTHRLTFDAGTLSSGIYFYRLKAGDLVTTKKLLYLR